MERQISLVKEEALAACRQAQTSAELEAIRVKYLGKKGEITQLLRGMGKVPPEERPRMGKLVNEARDELERALGAAGRKLAALEEERRLERERVDITLPGRRPPLGHKHPLTLVLEEIKHVFRGMGFDVVQGPEVETDYYNFEALNVPKFHPAGYAGHFLHNRRHLTADSDFTGASPGDGKAEAAHPDYCSGESLPA